jgi:ribosomal protein S18 acetylase RimI-like enzyme
MTIKTLEGLSIAEIAHAFNAAFIDYKIPMHLTEEQMATKMKAENLQQQFCAGAFDGDKLVGFILTGTDTIDDTFTAYNAGTGVLPPYRGQGISKQMYTFLIELIANNNCHQHVLEVFDDNVKAISAYKRVGFVERRKMNCYKGIVAHEASTSIEEVEIDDELFHSFWDIKPSWQNGFPSIKRNLEEHKVIGLKQGDDTVAYAIYTPHNNRLKHIAVKHDYRRRGYGTALLSFISKQNAAVPMVATCVEANEAVDAFFVKHNILPFIKMLEMELQLAKQRVHQQLESGAMNA